MKHRLTALVLLMLPPQALLLVPSLALAEEGSPPGADGADAAAMTLIQYGAIGVMLLLSIVGMIVLARYIASLYERILTEKEKQNQSNLKALEWQTDATTNLEATAAAMKETTGAMKTIVERFLQEREKEREWQIRERELSLREGDRR